MIQRVGFCVVPPAVVAALLLAACAPTAGQAPDGGGGCLARLAARGIPFDPVELKLPEHPEGHPELTCVIAEPIYLRSPLHGVSVRLAGDPAPRHFRTSCQLALQLDELAGILAAEGIVEVVHAGSHNCRLVAGSTVLSPHASALAFDLVQLKTRSGELLSVLGDWDGPSEASRWLHWLTEELYDRRVFNVIITPDHDAGHRDHLHLDLTPGAHFLSRRLPLWWLAGVLAGSVALAGGAVAVFRRRRKARLRARTGG